MTDGPDDTTFVPPAKQLGRESRCGSGGGGRKIILARRRAIGRTDGFVFERVTENWVGWESAGGGRTEIRKDGVTEA